VSTGKLVSLLRRFPIYLTELSISEDANRYQARQLDPMIDAGEEAADFIRSAAFRSYGQGMVLNRSVFDGLLETIFSQYIKVLNGAAVQLKKTGLPIDVSKGNAQQPPAYNFKFLNGDGVRSCKDAQPPFVTNVHSYRITEAGGSSGTDSVFLQKNFPNRDFGKEITTHFSRVSYRALQPDRSVLGAIPNVILLSEASIPARFEIILCLESFHISNLNMEKKTELDAEVKLKLFVIDKMLDPTKALYIMSLQARDMHVTLPTFNLIAFLKVNHPEFRGAQLAGDIWAQLKPKLGRALKPSFDDGSPFVVSSLTRSLTDEAGDDPAKKIDSAAKKDDAQVKKDELKAAMTTNYRAISSAIDDLLLQRQKTLVEVLAFPQESKAVEDLRRQLLLLTGVGLNMEFADVDLFSRRITYNSPLLPSVGELVDRLVMRGHSVESETQRMQTARARLNESLDDIAAHDYLRPMTTLLDQRLTELRSIRKWRENYARAQNTKPN
jgi:hypothetical protein